jgi:hypothetical protein
MHPSGDSLLTSLPNELQCFIFQKCGLLDLGNLAVTSVGIRECVLERSVGLVRLAQYIGQYMRRELNYGLTCLL